LQSSSYNHPRQVYEYKRLSISLDRMRGIPVPHHAGCRNTLIYAHMARRKLVNHMTLDYLTYPVSEPQTHSIVLCDIRPCAVVVEGRGPN
jgi:hypothetical protein